MTARGRTFAIGAGVLVALFAIFFLWVQPALRASPQETQTVGPSQFFALSADQGATRERSWSFSRDIQDPENTLVVPRLPWMVKVEPGSTPAESTLILDHRIFYNGHQVFRSAHAIPLTRSDTGPFGLGSIDDEPSDPNEIELGYLRKGLNNFTTTVSLQVKPTGTGTGQFRIDLGPIHARVEQPDRDGDGIADHDQLLPLHAGLYTVPAALGGGGAAAWGTARLFRRR